LQGFPVRGSAWQRQPTSRGLQDLQGSVLRTMPRNALKAKFERQMAFNE
jgi:hypothetical protein